MTTAASFWVSTTTISERYVPLAIVSVRHVVPAPAFGEVDFTAACQGAVALLAQAAQKLGGNGVIGISLTPSVATLGTTIFATGTAVHVAQ